MTPNEENESAMIVQIGGPHVEIVARHRIKHDRRRQIDCQCDRRGTDDDPTVDRLRKRNRATAS